MSVLRSLVRGLQRSLLFPGALRGRRQLIPSHTPHFDQWARDRNVQTFALIGSATEQVFGLTALGNHSRRRASHILFFYGNAMNLDCCCDVVDILTDLGCDVSAIDYIGYGRSTGAPSEAGCYGAADALYEYVVNVLHVPPAQVVAAGWSLGAAVAIDLASRRPLGKLIALSPFTSVADVAQAALKIHLPMSALLTDTFANADKIGRIKGHILIAHGTCDDVVPYEMGQRLASLAESGAALSVECVLLEGAGHSDMVDVIHPQLVQRLDCFLEPREGNHG